MKRSEAIGKIEDALALRHICTNPADFRDYARDQLALLEALGVLKFDEPVERAPTIEEVRRGLPFDGRPAPKSAADAIARVVLGPDYKVRGWRPGSGQPAESMWLVGPGPDGAGRILDALTAAGYRIVKPVADQREWVAPQGLEFLLIEREA